MKEYCLNEDNRCRCLLWNLAQYPNQNFNMIAAMSALVNVDVPHVQLSLAHVIWSQYCKTLSRCPPMVHQDSIASNNSSYVTASKKEQSKVRDKLFLFRQVNTLLQKLLAQSCALD